MILNIGGQLREWQSPVVMGIVNVTPDSFYAGSRRGGTEAVKTAGEMVALGCTIIDIGGCSTRPDSQTVTESEELQRLLPVVAETRRSLGADILISVDTFRASVAEACVDAGADIINDVSGGSLDPEMFKTVARLHTPYILTHMRGTPATMQSLADYGDVTAEVLQDLLRKGDELRQLGVADIILDPGFGFAKTTAQNFRLLDELAAFHEGGYPVLAGLSRKSMIHKTLGITPEDSLAGTVALNMVALMNGADILRVHDVKEAVQTVKLFEALRASRRPEERTITITDKTNLTDDPLWH